MLKSYCFVYTGLNKASSTLKNNNKKNPNSCCEQISYIPLTAHDNIMGK